MKTLRLLFWTAIAYAVLLFLVSGFLASETESAIPLTGIPLVVITVIIVRDLVRRSAVTSTEASSGVATPLKMDPVHFLSNQIMAAADASDSYFDDIVRARLKELLITKIVVETGQEAGVVRRSLSDPRIGPKLLGDPLYGILYGPIPSSERRRIEMVQNAVEFIGAWKG